MKSFKRYISELYTIGHTRSYDVGLERTKRNKEDGHPDPMSTKFHKVGRDRGEDFPGGAAYKTTKDAISGAHELKKYHPGYRYSVYKMKGDFDKHAYHNKETGMHHIKRDTEITHKVAHNVTESVDFSHDHHHTSVSKIDTDKHNAGKGKNPEHPMWLSHNAHQAAGWHKSAEKENGKAHTYKVKVNNIARHTDPKVKSLFKKHGHNMKDYHTDLVSNPNHKEVHNHPATKMLKKAGYNGHTHSDYHSHDFQKDHDSTVVFHRKHATMHDANKKPAHKHADTKHTVGSHSVTHKTHQEYMDGSHRPLDHGGTESRITTSHDHAKTLKTKLKGTGNRVNTTKNQSGSRVKITHSDSAARDTFHKHLKGLK